VEDPAVLPAPRAFLRLALPLAWCAALVLFRLAWYDVRFYRFIGWNLILAAVPLAAAAMFARSLRPSGSTAARLGWFALWLLFLPNAFYLVTDFVHLRPRPPVPLWYDIALLASATGTGFLYGYRSLAQVHAALARRAGALAAWSVVVPTLFLCAFGLYLGRFQRWNSWDLLTDPMGLLRMLLDRVAHPLSHTRTLGMTLIYGGALLVGYLVLPALVPGEKTPNAGAGGPLRAA
jgi:uncharacterized membrane protein